MSPPGGEEWRGDVYLLDRNPYVITETELEERLAHRPETIAEMDHIVMIQCVRSPAAPDYCSRICCTSSLKNAIRIKLLNPNCRGDDPVQRHHYLWLPRAVLHPKPGGGGVVFIRYDDASSPVVEEFPAGLRVTVQEPILKRSLVLEADLLALNMAIVPATGTATLARTLGVPLSSEGFYLEAHLKMRPMDFMAEGIFVAGMAHYPKFIEETIANAQAAAGRAITILSKQPPLHRRAAWRWWIKTSAWAVSLACGPVPLAFRKCSRSRPGSGDILGAAFIDPALCQGCRHLHQRVSGQGDSINGLYRRANPGSRGWGRGPWP